MPLSKARRKTKCHLRSRAHQNGTTAAAIALFGLASGVKPAFSQSGPKNLVSPTYRAPAASGGGAQELEETSQDAVTAELSPGSFEARWLLQSGSG